jgi:glutamate N-acetyltransferase/amino-acid N-acetyltransferase
MLRKNSIVVPRGFLTASCNCGIKRKKLDLVLFFSEVPASCAGVFTTNRVKAAPVILSQKIVRRGFVRGIVANSGNANALTGKEGIEDAKKIIRFFSHALGIREDELLIASTGVIGIRLPVKKIISKAEFLVKSLSSDAESFVNSAMAIMTTDSFYKLRSEKVKTKNGDFSILGIAKGAGMICPQMATMLCFIFTDADASPSTLKKVLRDAVENSFNRITVDGDRSTNDTVFILSNGKSGISIDDPKIREIFSKSLKNICMGLAEDIVRDGEGATKIFSVHVIGAKNNEMAKKIAYSVANSLLVKTAVYGGEPNYGRIAASVGASGVRFDQFRLKIWVNDKLVVSDGKMLSLKRDKSFLRKKIDFKIEVGNGKGEAVVFSSDLTPEYVRLNAGYMS